MQSPKARATRSRRFWGAKAKKGSQQFYTGRFLPKCHPFTFSYTTKGTTVVYLKTFQYTPKWQISPRANLGGGCRGCAPSSPSEMTCGFLMLVFAKCCMRVSRNKEWRRGGGGAYTPYTPLLFFLLLFFPLSSQYERLEHARQRKLKREQQVLKLFQELITRSEQLPY